MAIDSDTQYNLDIIIDADAAMFAYLTKRLIHDVWPRKSDGRDERIIYSTLVKMLDPKQEEYAPDIGWSTEGAIKKGVNRILAHQTWKFHGDTTKYKVGIDQVRSLLNVAIGEDSIERHMMQYLMRPDSVTFYRLTSSFFQGIIDHPNLPKYEPSN